jgi:AcrR family transcriptional regulator
MFSGSSKEIRDNELSHRVLDAAEEIIGREGIQHLTMRRIAAAVDYSPTVLYRLFDSKADLMDHLITRGYEGVRRDYEKTLKREHDTPLAALQSLLLTYATYALDHPNHYRTWFGTGLLSTDGESLRMRHGRVEYTVFQTWFDLIEGCRAAGGFAGRTAHEVFQVLWARVHGLISLRMQHPDLGWMPLEEHLDQVLALPRGEADGEPG